MKMAKASEADIEMAMTLANCLEDIEKGYFPSALNDPDDDPDDGDEWLDTDDREQYHRLIVGLQEIIRKGSICRVIWGMAVCCDPSNKLIDPDADTLEWHPDNIKAHEQRDDLLETLESAYNIAVEHDGLFPFDWAIYCEMLHAAIVRAKSGGHPEEQAETAIPSLIFYPAGSLGEEVAE